MDLFSNNIVYSDVVNQIKSWIINNNQDSSMLQELNVHGSNLSTLIDIVAYIYMVSNVKNEIYFNEYSLFDAKLETNQIKRAMEFGVIPQSKTASKIKLLIGTKFKDIITSTDGGNIILSSDNPNIQFYCKIENAITITPSSPIELEFIQAVEQTQISFNVNTNITSFDSVVILPLKNDIEYSTFSISNDVDTFVKFDNTIDLSTYDNTKIYYILDFSGDTAKIRFLGGFIGKNYQGVISVKYYTTSGVDGNGINDKNLKIKSTTLKLDNGITALDKNDVKIITRNKISSNGTNQTDSNIMKYLAISSFKSQQAIIQKDDLYWYLKSKYNGYEIIIITPEEQYKNISAGVIYVAMYRVINGVVTHFDYDNEDFTELYKKLSLGAKIIFFNVSETNLRLNATAMINKNVNENLISNVIKSEIFNSFSNKKYFSKYDVQQKIVSGGINGLVGFNVNDMNFSIKRILTNYNLNNFYYRMNSYTKLPSTVYETLLNTYFDKYSITLDGVDKKIELMNKLKFNFNNLTTDIITYQIQDEFYTMPINFNIENFIDVVKLKPLSKKSKNIILRITTAIAYNSKVISKVTSLNSKQKVVAVDNNVIIDIENPYFRKCEFNESGIAYFIDEEIKFEVTFDDDTKITVTLCEMLDNTTSKKIIGFFNIIDSYDKTKTYMIANNRIVTQTNKINDVEQTSTISGIEVEVISDIIYSSSDIILLNRDDIKITFSKI